MEKSKLKKQNVLNLGKCRNAQLKSKRKGRTAKMGTKGSTQTKNLSTQQTQTPNIRKNHITQYGEFTDNSHMRTADHANITPDLDTVYIRIYIIKK